ncbi:MAG: hypothetical protein R3321_05100 [Nitrososphaeraceae archaeon]|nr:hypothetical protein [Nitrososphaeraceae archaeon]
MNNELLIEMLKINKNIITGVTIIIQTLLLFVLLFLFAYLYQDKYAYTVVIISCIIYFFIVGYQYYFYIKSYEQRMQELQPGDST